MTVSAWRIFKPQHQATAYTGDGARLFGGRWNSQGTAAVYLAGSISLAALEMLVHLENQHILSRYLLAEVEFGEELITAIVPDELPRNWQESPPPVETKSLGDAWANSQRSAILRVPSVIVESEFNFVLNPLHRGFSSIRIGAPVPFRFDARLTR